MHNNRDVRNTSVNGTQTKKSRCEKKFKIQNEDAG